MQMPLRRVATFEPVPDLTGRVDVRDENMLTLPAEPVPDGWIDDDHRSRQRARADVHDKRWASVHDELESVVGVSTARPDRPAVQQPPRSEREPT